MSASALRPEMNARMFAETSKRNNPMLAVTYGGVRTPATAFAKSVHSGLRNGFFARFMAALRETRRQQARCVIERYADLSSDESRLVSSNPWLLATAPSASERPLRCPITGHPCDGDLSHLCEDYGCARKGGLSPRSDENL